MFEVLNRLYGSLNRRYGLGLLHISVLNLVCREDMCGFRLFVFSLDMFKDFTLGICVLVDEGTNSPLELDADVSDRHMVPR